MTKNSGETFSWTSWRIKAFKLTAFALKLSKFDKSFIDDNISIHWTYPSWSCGFTDVIFFISVLASSTYDKVSLYKELLAELFNSLWKQ